MSAAQLERFVAEEIGGRLAFDEDSECSVPPAHLVKRIEYDGRSGELLIQWGDDRQWQA